MNNEYITFCRGILTSQPGRDDAEKWKNRIIVNGYKQVILRAVPRFRTFLYWGALRSPGGQGEDVILAGVACNPDRSGYFTRMTGTPATNKYSPTPQNTLSTNEVAFEQKLDLTSELASVHKIKNGISCITSTNIFLVI